MRRPVGDARVGAARSSRSSTTTRRSRSCGSSSSTCCGSTSRRRRPPPGTSALGELHAVGKRLDARRLRRAAVRGAGHRSDGRPPPHVAVRRRGAGHRQTVDGVVFNPNLPTEEVVHDARPDAGRGRRDGDEAARRRRHGRAGTCGFASRAGAPFEIDADENADALRARVREGRRRGAARRGRARRPRGPDRQDGHGVLQHAARRERREPPRARQRLRDRRSARRTATASTRARSTSTS